MTLQEVQAAGRFASRPGGNLIYVPGEGVLLLLVNEGAVIFDTLRPEGDLPPWALAGWRHERGCPCGCWQESPPDPGNGAGATRNGSGDPGRVRRLLRAMVPHRTRSG
jgi:hypothetical protein